MSNRSSDASNILGAIGVAIVVLIAMVPKPVWIALGIVAAVAVVTWIVYAIVKEVENSHIDASLRAEREDAKVAEQRAALYAKLYGIEAAPDTTPADSAAEAVMARV
ncbi:hypothetical protein [Mycolicibacterium bacteremicum]|uniref:Uncharacterized protein n=1 Tax=Mycolicibacterium bacteremicum TaxID=564198 RepID=A0A1W9YSH2_MYCBA|nr:hypothetical protein [Mycolicibacterium bacteremicum]MCV7434911.1 hypothetical protein [Mycolicibacterium bacteremicum]ORA03038.1 hypothetical protein BST17_20860 [Mycolicibacterium bacteremicum]